MDLGEIKKIIANSESRFIEYKQSIAELDKLGKAICGFLNIQGGIGFLGITDKKKIIGIEVSDSTKKKLASFCNYFDPWPELKIYYVPLPGTDKQVVVIEASSKDNKMPFTYKGTPYLRNESTLNKMPAEVYKQRLMETAGLSKVWESLPAPKYTLNDLDQEEILRTFKVGLKEERIPEDADTDDVKEILTSFDLIDDAVLNNAAMVLFAKEMPADYSQCFLRMGRFIDETMDNVLDSKQIRGNVFQLLEEALNFVKKHLPIASHYDPNQLERIDEPALPMLAVREAIVNSLCHRDYSNHAGDIALFIFNTHLEIHNIGHLYGGLTVDSLKRRHASRRRNAKIAQVFYVRKLIERYGGGTLRMIDLCKQQGLRPPDFSEAGDGFLVKFYFKEPIGPHRQIIQHDKQHKFSNRERELLDILAMHGKLSFKDIMSYLKNPPSDRTVRNELSSLRSKGLVSSEGYGRGAVWFIKEKQE